MATLGILITSERYSAYANELARAAHQKGHAVRLHLTGPGVKICHTAAFKRLSTWAEVTICRHSAEQLGLVEALEKTSPHLLMAENHMAEIIMASDRHLVL